MKRALILPILALFLLAGCTTVAVEETQTPFEVLVSSVINRNGESVAIDADYILLYYAADWCPYCIEYAEQLKQTYTQLKRMYGSSIELIFAGHINDQSNDDLIAFLDQGSYPFAYLPYEKRPESAVMEMLGEYRFYIPGFLLVDREGKILASSNGETKDDYVRDRPLYQLQNLLMQDCASCQK
jgi:thiol-disulfide isomerase/thioredoxin